MIKTLYDKIGRLLVLILCFSVFPFRGKTDKKQSNYSNILVIPPGKLGDVVCVTPVFFAIRQQFPEARIFVLGNKMTKAVLKDSGLVDVYLDDEGFVRNFLKIKRAKIDFACVNSFDFMKLAGLYLSGIPLISAPEVINANITQETKPYKLLVKLVAHKNFILGDYLPRQYLYLIESLGIFSDNTKKHLGFSKDAEEKISRFFKKENLYLGKDLIVGISPSAGNKIKLWKAEKFAKISDYLYQKYNAKIIIIGDKEDIKESKEMIRHIDKDTFFINTTGVFSIDALKGLISKLNLFISVDTGPIYISEAFNVPTIDIVGPINENEQPPIGKFNKIVKDINRSNSAINILDTRNYDYKKAREQSDNILVADVIKVIDELMPLLPKNIK